MKRYETKLKIQKCPEIYYTTHLFILFKTSMCGFKTSSHTWVGLLIIIMRQRSRYPLHYSWGDLTILFDSTTNTFKLKRVKVYHLEVIPCHGSKWVSEIVRKNSSLSVLVGSNQETVDRTFKSPFNKIGQRDGNLSKRDRGLYGDKTGFITIFK